VQKLWSELKNRSPYAEDGTVSDSYILLKIKLDREIVSVQDRIREKKEKELELENQRIGGEVQRKREEWERQNKLQDTKLIS
jgi:hypothetical protein